MQMLNEQQFLAHMERPSPADTNLLLSHHSIDPVVSLPDSTHKSPTHETERRSSRRYCFDAPLKVSIGPAKKPIVAVEGSLVNISRTGVLIALPAPLRLGEKVILSIEWPAQRDPQSPIYMRIVARTLRTQEFFAALEILHCRFPFRGQSILAERAVSNIGPGRSILRTL
jgi:hypothetical protein